MPYLNIKYSTTTSPASRRASHCAVVGIYEDNYLGTAAAEIDSASRGLIKRYIKDGDLNGKLGSAQLLFDLVGVKADRVLVVGLGKVSSFGIRQFRQALGTATNVLSRHRIRDASIYLTLEDVAEVSPYYLARYAVQAVGENLYCFSALKGDCPNPLVSLRSLTLALQRQSQKHEVIQGARHADAIVNGMSFAKDLANLPANICTPTYLARTARQMARELRNVQTEVISESEMKKLGMHALLSVTAGSSLPAKLIVMRYKGAARKAPVVLVGKGVTFDSGGISLKPPEGMEAMKFDMGGAAAVIATIATAANLQLPVNLVVIVPACENLPGGTATRPGDIVSSMSGHTIEILNTDAEGRLMLCDALTYAGRFKPALLIDVATLTGAAAVALGHHFTALMSNNDDLAETMINCGNAADDRCWRMPLSEEYERQLDSDFADFANVAHGRDGGAIVAACFLAKFVGNLPWAHLDTGGTDWPSPNNKYGSGRPVAMLTEFLLKRAKALPSVL